MMRKVEAHAWPTTPEVAAFSRRTGAELGLFATAAQQGRHPGAPEAARQR